MNRKLETQGLGKGYKKRAQKRVIKNASKNGSNIIGGF